jgi:hypothetical protein
MAVLGYVVVAGVRTVADSAGPCVTLNVTLALGTGTRTVVVAYGTRDTEYVETAHSVLPPLGHGEAVVVYKQVVTVERTLTRVSEMVWG